MIDDHAAWLSSLETHHDLRVSRLRSIQGWLSLVGKTFLHDGRSTLGAVPSSNICLPAGSPNHLGALSVQGTSVTLELTAEANGTIDGKPIPDGHPWDASQSVHVQGFVLSLMHRDSLVALRVRDARHLPSPFSGISRFAPEPTWRKKGRFLAHRERHEISIELEGAPDGANVEMSLSPDNVQFDHDGRLYELITFFDDEKRRLYIPFRDHTSGNESYDAGRFIYTPLPSQEGSVELDFNKAMMPGCAFSVFATCPIPPKQNRLSCAVRAGEQHYLGAPVGS